MFKLDPMRGEQDATSLSVQRLAKTVADLQDRMAAYGFVANSHFRKSRPSAAVENEAIGVNLAR